MKAVKENKVYTLTNEHEAEYYRLKGFDILDDDNNIFECQMVYKGKNKAKKKS